MAPEQKVEQPDWNWNWEREEEELEEEESEEDGAPTAMEQQWSPAFADLAAPGPKGGPECDCAGLPPPPRFSLPPPPLPFSAAPRCPSSDSPSGAHSSSNSGGGSSSELEFCSVEGVLQGGPYTQPAIPSVAVIVVCSLIVLLTVLLASLIFWRHKRKMQNFLPCKTSPANNHCDVIGGGVGGGLGVGGAGSTVLYEDLTNIRPRNMMANHCLTNQTQLPPMERLEDNTLLDAKCSSNYGGAGFTSVGDTAFSCLYPLGAPAPPSSSSVCSLQPKDNMYEEISASSDGGGGGGCARGPGGPPRVCSAVDSDTEPEEEEEGPRGGRRVSAGSSEGELAGDELSLVDFPCGPAEPEVNGVSRHCSETSSLRGSTGDDLCRDFEDDGQRRAGAPTRVYNSNNNNNNLFAGPTLFLSNTEQRKRRRNRGGRHNGVDLVRLPPQYHNNSAGRPVNGNHSPWMPRSTSSGGPVNGGGGSWREARQNNRGYDDYDLAEGGPPMLLAIPPASFNTTGHMHRSCSSHSPQAPPPPPMTELNVPKLSLPYQQQQQQPRGAPYRDSQHEEWDGAEASGGLHERTIGEFNSFRPRRNGGFRDGYGVLAPAYFVNDHSPQLSKSASGGGGGPGALYPYQHISKQPHAHAHFFPDLEQANQSSGGRKKKKGGPADVGVNRIVIT